MTEEKSDEVAKNDRGFIYILINASMHGVLKIGHCKESPNDRATQLSSATGVPFPFTVAWFEEVPLWQQAEQQIHSRLDAFRINRKREFFHLPLNEAIRVMMEVAHEFRERYETEQRLCSGTAQYEREQNAIAPEVKAAILAEEKLKRAAEERRRRRWERQITKEVAAKEAKTEKEKEKEMKELLEPFTSDQISVENWMFSGGTWILRREDPIVPDFTND